MLFFSKGSCWCWTYFYSSLKFFISQRFILSDNLWRMLLKFSSRENCFSFQCFQDEIPSFADLVCKFFPLEKQQLTLSMSTFIPLNLFGRIHLHLWGKMGKNQLHTQSQVEDMVLSWHISNSNILFVIHLVRWVTRLIHTVCNRCQFWVLGGTSQMFSMDDDISLCQDVIRDFRFLPVHWHNQK